MFSQIQVASSSIRIARKVCCRARLELHRATGYVRCFATAPRPASRLPASGDLELGEAGPEWPANRP